MCPILTLYNINIPTRDLRGVHAWYSQGLDTLYANLETLITFYEYLVVTYSSKDVVKTHFQMTIQTLYLLW